MNISIKSIVIVLIMVASNLTLAEGKSNGGDEFRKAAQAYEAKADKYQKKGLTELSNLYGRQAEIKRHAAGLGDAGSWDEIDWTEYHENEAKINTLLKGKKYKKKH